MPRLLLFIFTLCSFLLGCANKKENSKEKEASEAISNSNPASFKPAQTPPEYLIARSQIGKLKIGMSVATLKEVIPANNLKEVPIYKEGQGYKAYEVRNNPEDAQAALRIEEKCAPECRVWRIQVLDPSYRAANGLGINSSLGAVRKHYPISYLGAGETEIVAVSEKEKITFMLDVSHLPPHEVSSLNNNNTPDSVRVLGMYIY